MICKLAASFLRKNSILLSLILFIIVALSVSNVFSIKCYQCKEPDNRCRDPFQNDTLFFKPCPLNATKCRKYKWEIGDGRTYFERGCAIHGEVSRREGRNCIERVGNFRTRMWYCICDNKDGCNSAPTSNILLRQRFLLFDVGNSKFKHVVLVLFISIVYFKGNYFTHFN